MDESDIPLKEKLNLETAKINWKELEVFFARGSLLTVPQGCDLIITAELIASNDQQAVEKLILEKKIEFVTPDWAKNNCKPSTELWTVVVAPYVICQLA